jgi:ribosomal protein S18 acetylase RimI-like enzyme
VSEIRFEIVTGDDVATVEIARALFREYEAWLEMDLCFQGFEAELMALPGKYALPEGRLILAFVGKEVAGCVALRKLDEKTCEMKRLFVLPAFQGLGIGVRLIDMVIAASKEIGCDSLRLDTYPPKMGKAVGLYRVYGFREIEPYYDNPNAQTLFMELDLKSHTPLPKPVP